MQKYLQLLLELIRPENDEENMSMKENFLAVGEKIENRDGRNLKIFHRDGFVFDAYDKLISGEISLDEFLAIGDITSENILLDNAPEFDSLSFLNNVVCGEFDNNIDYQNTLYVFDIVSFISLSDVDQQKIQDWAKKQNSELLFC